jgi:formamidopyrimidine-DNA glycosylase
MPELPEVHTVTQILRKNTLGSTILKTQIFDDKIIRNVGPEKFILSTQGATIKDTYRRGKYLFIHLDNDLSILMHLGMTGDPFYHNDIDESVKHERFRWVFSNGVILSYVDMRKFSRILVLDDVEDYLKEIKLGPDALEISQIDFMALNRNSTRPIKSWLMDQKVMSGLGNLYVDEICFQSAIHPASITTKVPAKVWDLIFTKMKSILKTAVEREAYYQEYPEGWFWQWRKEGEIGPGGNPVLRIKIGGRSTFFVDQYQRFY